MTVGRIAAFLKKHSLWAGFLAALAPLLVMLALQFVWLARLKQVSALAQKAAHSNYLEAIGTEVQYFYRATAERALNLPASLFTEKRLEEAAHYWSRKPVKGVRRLFLVDYTRDPFGNFYVFDPDHSGLDPLPASDEALAIIVACAPLQIQSYRGSVSRSQALKVDERDAEFRLILNPITDDALHVVGVTGMILDEEHFKARLLPAVIDKALPVFFPGSGGDYLTVTVRNASGEVILSTRDDRTGGESATEREAAYRGVSASSPFPFVFTDWTMSLHGPGTTPEQWARVNFAYNVALSAVLAAVLVGGIVLALRAADRAVRLSEMKSDFVSNVSHELRTPLASIRVFAELLRLGRVQSQDKVQEYGEYIEAESRRLSRLIDNILDFARIESGRKEYEFVLADLREVVAATVRTFDAHLRHSGFRVTLEGLDRPLPEASIDADAIGQALHNLLDNAVKYSGDSKEIEVRLAEDGGFLVLSVRDHGIGIPRGEQEKIFDRFHRVGTALVHEVKGSGLGLSIVRHIVQVHGGRVSVESGPGAGSTFTIRLPVRREAGEEACPGS
ncbi:MAG: HAMP domain-containing histidine kinase [Acidobacteria bacterium]|nr:HAMP domain-containing histidine kinase [Acidobacteriota bacterium]